MSKIFFDIAEFLKDYELKEKNKKLCNIEIDNKLYKLKEILKMYPMLTTYSVNKAVNDNKLSATIIGKCRYYQKKDIENYLNSKKKSAYSIRSY